MGKWLPLTLMLLALAPAAHGQVSLTPEPQPRLPPQPGQGLPVEDQRFLSRAANLSQVEIETGRLAAQEGESTAVKDLAQRLATDHEAIAATLRELAEQYGTAIEAHESQEWWQGEIERLRGLDGAAFDHDYLALQLRAHAAMAELYQQQASETTQTELATFAITTFNRIQDHFATTRDLAGQYGLTIDRVEQPPQY